TNYLIYNEHSQKALAKIYPNCDIQLINEEIKIIQQIKGNFSYDLPLTIGDLMYDFPSSGYFTRILHYTEGATLHQEDINENTLKEVAQAAARMLSVLSQQESTIYHSRVHEWNLRDAFLNFSQYILISF
ncbi:MAG TPA: hypothetical protein PKD85_03225, partial [Saprospiraceae bacterium]|nr:hypothetical protein [Saprospiraceae bacterium]